MNRRDAKTAEKEESKSFEMMSLNGYWHECRSKALSSAVFAPLRSIWASFKRMDTAAVAASALRVARPATGGRSDS
jgi:hypothetical protein